MGVEALAAQRDEQIARRDAARVAVDARDRRRHAADERASGSSARRRRASSSSSSSRRSRASCVARACERAARVTRIGEREPRAADVLVVLVALAGDEDDVFGGAALPIAWRIASARFSITSTSSWPIAPARICARIEVGRFEARVVAGDDDAVGEPAGDRAHQRPLGRVAVAAAAEHAPEPAAARLARAGAARRAPSRAHRACGRSRRRPAVTRLRRASPTTRCIRPGTGVSAAHAAAASASGTPSARSTPITHEQVGDVVVADQRRRDRRPAASPSTTSNGEAVAVVAQRFARAGAPTRRASRRSSSRRAEPRERIGELAAPAHRRG